MFVTPQRHAVWLSRLPCRNYVQPARKLLRPLGDIACDSLIKLPKFTGCRRPLSAATCRMHTKTQPTPSTRMYMFQVRKQHHLHSSIKWYEKLWRQLRGTLIHLLEIGKFSHTYNKSIHQMIAPPALDFSHQECFELAWRATLGYMVSMTKERTL